MVTVEADGGLGESGANNGQFEDHEASSAENPRHGFHQ